MQGQFNTPEFKLFSEFEEGQGGGGGIDLWVQLPLWNCSLARTLKNKSKTK